MLNHNSDFFITTFYKSAYIKIMAYSKVIFNSKQILKNLQSLPTKNLCAVVKANAYGVGLKKVCETLKENVKFFAVATLEEALIPLD